MRWRWGERESFSAAVTLAAPPRWNHEQVPEDDTDVPTRALRLPLGPDCLCIFCQFTRENWMLLVCEGCSDETGVRGRGWRWTFGSFLRRGDHKQACPLVSGTAGRRTVANRPTKHTKRRVITPSPSIHGPQRWQKSPLSVLPCPSINTPSLPGLLLLLCFPPYRPPPPHRLLLFLAVDIFLSIHSAALFPPTFIALSISVAAADAPVFAHMPRVRLRSRSRTRSSTSVCSRRHLQIST